MNPKTTTRWPGVPEAFVSKFGDLFTAVLSGWDRLRLCGTLRPLFNPEWMRAHLCAGKVLLKDFRGHAEGLTEQIHARALAAAAEVGRPYRFLKTSRTSKEGIARELVQRDHVRAGLVTVLGAVEPCVAMTVRLNRESGRLEPRLEDRRALHLYHYFQHEQFGLCHVRVQTWYPFTVEVWVNGREWLARQMDEAGIAYVRRDNCFTHLADPVRAQSLCAAQERADWPRLLNDLLARAHPLHPQITRPLHLDYYWTALQSEHATDLLCRDAGTLARIYPAWVRHGLNSFGCLDIMRFLGHRVPATTGRVNGRFQAEALANYRHRPEGVRLKHWVGQNSIKVYDKAGQVLRVETTLNAPEVFKLWLGPTQTKRKRGRGQAPKEGWRRLRRSVTDLPARAELSRAANARYLQALAATGAGRPLGETVAQVCAPVTWQQRRYRALRLFAAPETAVLTLINRGDFTVEGFRNADVQGALFISPARSTKEKRRRSSAAGRWLRLLRAHGLIRKVPGRHRYLVSEKGRELITLVLTAQHADVQKLSALAA
ncbi:MAG: hypothetical protein Q8N18_09490 [Opitutaceae bacterium]|nr:hypothetical protein [Opitutaceae bacterium]